MQVLTSLLFKTASMQLGLLPALSLAVEERFPKVCHICSTFFNIVEHEASWFSNQQKSYQQNFDKTIYKKQSYCNKKFKSISKCHTKNGPSWYSNQKSYQIYTRLVMVHLAIQVQQKLRVSQRLGDKVKWSRQSLESSVAFSQGQNVGEKNGSSSATKMICLESAHLGEVYVN